MMGDRIELKGLNIPVSKSKVVTIEGFPPDAARALRRGHVRAQMPGRPLAWAEKEKKKKQENG